MLMLLEPPLQIVAVPEMAPVGRAFTVTTADPVRSPACEVPLASDSVATVYVVLDVGDTDTEIGLLLPLNEVPSLRVPLQGPVPLTAILRLADPPLQMDCVPVITEVGRTVTVTSCEREQLFCVFTDTVYVVVDAGVAVTVAPDAALSEAEGDQL